MHKIFDTTGQLHWVTDAQGKPIKSDWPIWNVAVTARYELRAAPHEPLVLDIYGYQLVASRQCTYKLVLDNGVELTGRASGGGIDTVGDPPRLQKVRMCDIEQRKLELHPTDTTAPNPEIDAAVFGVVSSHPLGLGNGFAHPSRPFTFATNTDGMKTWTNQAQRFRHRNLEITVVGASRYWKGMVDSRSLDHESVVGVRRVGGGGLPWEELNDFIHVLSNFIGWLNHCAAPVFHIKAYRKGRLVYRGYDLHPHVTVQRDRFSWFPSHGIKDELGKEALGQVYSDLAQELLGRFAEVWECNRKARGTFHVALQLLRGGNRGGRRTQPSVAYLRDTFTACAILERMLTRKSSASGRQAQIARCLKAIGVADKLPSLDADQLDFAVREHPELWSSAKNDSIIEKEKTRSTMSRPLANLTNWLLHLDDPRNSERLLGLGTPVQMYFVQVSIWLADLLLLKVVGYGGWYFNRLTKTTEPVPWSR